MFKIEFYTIIIYYTQKNKYKSPANNMFIN